MINVYNLFSGSNENHNEAQPIIEHTPLNSEHTPLNSEYTPLSLEHTPLSSEHTPLSSEHTPLSSEHTPLSLEHTPLSSEHTPLSSEGKNKNDEEEKTRKEKDYQLDLSREIFEEIEEKDEKQLFLETESTIPFRGQNNPFESQEPSSCNPVKGDYDHTQDQILERNFETLNLTLENFDVPR